jgi:sortase (surface protein transpeptidase)
MWKKILLLYLLTILTACQNSPVPPAPIPRLAVTADAVAAQPTAIAVQSSEPVAPDAAGIPIRLAAPAVALAVAVESMGWQITQVEGERKAIWEVPQESAGWHLNSARPGTAGNIVLSGHHLLGAAVFAAVARGELMIGDQLLLTDDQGHISLYQVSEVGQPIPVTDGTQEEQAQAAAYLASTDQAVLTLVTGWPDFSDTHYFFVRAAFVGVVQ